MSFDDTTTQAGGDSSFELKPEMVSTNEASCVKLINDIVTPGGSVGIEKSVVTADQEFRDPETNIEVGSFESTMEKEGLGHKHSLIDIYRNTIIYMLDKVNPLIVYSSELLQTTVEKLSLETVVYHVQFSVAGQQVSVPIIAASNLMGSEVQDLKKWLHYRQECLVVMLEEKANIVMNSSSYSQTIGSVGGLDFMGTTSNAYAKAGDVYTATKEVTKDAVVKAKESSKKLMELCLMYVEYAQSKGEPQALWIREAISSLLVGQYEGYNNTAEKAGKLMRKISDMRDFVSDTISVSVEATKHHVLPNNNDIKGYLLDRSNIAFERVRSEITTVIMPRIRLMEESITCHIDEFNGSSYAVATYEYIENYKHQLRQISDRIIESQIFAAAYEYIQFLITESKDVEPEVRGGMISNVMLQTSIMIQLMRAKMASLLELSVGNVSNINMESFHSMVETMVNNMVGGQNDNMKGEGSSGGDIGTDTGDIGDDMGYESSPTNYSSPMDKENVKPLLMKSTDGNNTENDIDHIAGNDDPRII